MIDKPDDLKFGDPLTIHHIMWVKSLLERIAELEAIVEEQKESLYYAWERSMGEDL